MLNQTKPKLPREISPSKFNALSIIYSGVSNVSQKNKISKASFVRPTPSMRLIFVIFSRKRHFSSFRFRLASIHCVINHLSR